MALFTRSPVRQAYRNAFFRATMVAAPVLAIQAVLLAWSGLAAWGLPPVAVALLMTTTYALIPHAAGHRRIASTLVPASFSVAYVVVMAFGFGPAFGFHYLLLILLPLVLGWDSAGEAGRWGAATALCFFILWVELEYGGAFLARDATVAARAGLFRAFNLASALLMLAAFIRLMLDFTAQEQRGAHPARPAARNGGAGQPERRRLIDSLGRPHRPFLETGRIFSVIFLEIDHHPAIAEIFGRLPAEQVSAQASAVLIGKVRETDMISRRGQSAFMIFLPETVEEEAYVVAERIRGAIGEHPLPAGDISLNVSVTLGVAQSASNADVESAIVDAERAAVAGRMAGRNRTMLAGLL